LRDPLLMTRDVLGVRARRERPSLPALTVQPAPGERRRSQSRITAELHRALGPNFPIVVTAQTGSTVLLPLCDPIEVQNVAARLRTLPTKLDVKERSLRFRELIDLMPFQWVDGERDGFVLAVKDQNKPIVTRPPVAGWEILRTKAETRTERGPYSRLIA
jgi:hypothetical protein